LSASVHVAESLGELDPLLPGWDRLAASVGQPYSRPDWLLEWWRARTAGKGPADRLRVILVCDAQGLAGVAPMFVESARARVAHWRFLGQGAFPGVGLLVRPEGADDTIRFIARAIASSRPPPGILFMHAIDIDCAWPESLARSWPDRRAWVRERARTTATSIRLDGAFDDWLRDCGRSWAADHCRLRRRLIERGGVVRRARDAEDVSRGLAALIRLHKARWASQQRWLTPAVDQTLRVAGERLAARDGFRLWLVELDGQIIGASAFAVAGRTVSLLVTAHDRDWKSLGPGLASIVAGVEESFQIGDELVDLSYGAYPYKLRLANEVRWLSWRELFPRDRRYPLARAHALPWHVREAVDRARARVQARTRLTEAWTRVSETAERGLRR
jgi:CelD/BcsL family acetyltransferase involved in cellulose biosynthesis